MDKIKEQRTSLQMKRILTILDNEDEADRDFHLHQHEFGTIELIYSALGERFDHQYRYGLHPTRKAAIYRTLKSMTDRGMLERVPHIDSDPIQGLPIKYHCWHIAGKVERDKQLEVESRARRERESFIKAKAAGNVEAVSGDAPEPTLVVINPEVAVTPHTEGAVVETVPKAFSPDEPMRGMADFAISEAAYSTFDKDGISYGAYIDAGWTVEQLHSVEFNWD